jgi:hypothetical protein
MLHRRGSVYASRIIIPADLRPILERREITRSLRTEDRRAAARRLSLWESYVETYFTALRAQHCTMTREQLDEFTRRYLRATFDEIEERLALKWRPADRDAHAFALEEKGHATAGALAEGDFASVSDKARALAPRGHPRGPPQVRCGGMRRSAAATC